MSWGYDKWLTDRGLRQDWMRSIALVRLVEQVLRTPATAGEGLACILDEVLDDANPWAVAQIGERVAMDASHADQWLRAALTTARAKAVPLQSVALVLPDMAPWRLELAAVNAPVHDHALWDESITWRFSDELDTRVLDDLLPIGGAPEAVRKQADYIVPLAYSAFLLSDVLRAADAAEWAPVRQAIVIYAGGDSIDVPLTRNA